MQLGAGQVIGGRYRAVEPLGAGGMGSVWRARHTELDVDMALKVMSGELAGSTVAAERFRREARAAAMLRSPHVVHIHDYGVEEGHPYMVMELLAGEDLRAFIRREGAVSLRRAVSIVLPVCKALRVAHQAGIIHRDIKPANIFMARAGDEEQVKVLDFGIAKEQREPGAQGDTTSQQVLGSPLYMSPEQSRGASLDARTDLWSLAVVAYELVVGQQPFRGPTLGDVFARICGDDVPAPSSAGVEHPGLDAFFRKALARSPGERFPTADALGEAFAALVEGAARTGAALGGRDEAGSVPAVARSARDEVPTAAVPTPLSVVIPRDQAESDEPPRRGRDSDTLALAATSPDRTQPGAPVAPAARGVRARTALGLGVAVALASVLVVALQRKDPQAGAQDEASAANSDTRPAPPPAAPAPPPAEPEAAKVAATAAPAAPSMAPPSLPRRAAPAVAGTGAVVAGAVAGAAARRSPGAAAATGAAAPATAAPVVTAVPAVTGAPRRDPVFGVPVTTP